MAPNVPGDVVLTSPVGGREHVNRTEAAAVLSRRRHRMDMSRNRDSASGSGR
jgi:hypothetical protein